MMMYLTALICYLLAVYGEEDIIAEDVTVTIASSCNEHADKDGLYYIKPTSTGEIIPVICNNGYTMLDGSLNLDSLSTYFTSFYRWGSDVQTIYGTDCSDSSGWRDWFIPANKNTKFRVAIGCNECKPGDMFGDNTAYYMTSGYFCPVAVDRQGCIDAVYSLDNPFCWKCDDTAGMCGSSGGREGEYTGKWCDCYTLQLTSDTLTTNKHNEYCQNGLSWRPNLLIDRSQCTCYKPQEADNEIYTDISPNDLPLVSSDYRDKLYDDDLYISDLIRWDDDEDSDTEEDCGEKHIYLTQEDFEYGTYRITECGNYILTEDVVLNFNKPTEKFVYENGDSPNAYDLENLPWFPTIAQQQSGKYFGLDAFWGPYSIGFFAGISVETDSVYIDLGGYSISMDPEFYLQQRFFAIIELGNKQFEARQGPVDFGRDDIKITDIQIKNGILGLTSHHGIHGAGASKVEITDLEIMNFDVGGIQCNACNNMLIEGTSIGPQNMNIPVLGRYTHGRVMLSRMRYLVQEYGDETIRFANRHQDDDDDLPTVRDLCDRLIEQMDMVYYHLTQGIEFEEDNEQWIRARETFINPSGWLDGGSAYGILINGAGTAVVNIGRRTSGVSDITIRNVEIHDLKVKPHENFWASAGTDGKYAIVHGFFFETLDWNYGRMFDPETGYYLGDTYTDILFAANRFFRSDFCPLGSLFNMDDLVPWAFEDKFSMWDDSIGLEFRCGSDIQSHSAKGAIGIRVDGCQGMVIDNVYIHNLVNWGELGSDQCGEYNHISFETGVDVDKDIQYGYSGNNVHGILTDYAEVEFQDIQIKNLNSWHGSTLGIAVYKGSVVQFNGKVQMDNLVAGDKLLLDHVEKLKLPNAQPFVCSIFIGPNSDEDTDPDITPVIDVTDDFTSSVSDTFYGYDYCEQHERIGDMDTPYPPEQRYENMNKNANANINVFNTFGERLLHNKVQYRAIISGLIITIIIIMMLLIRKTIYSGNGYKNEIDRLSSYATNDYGSI